MNWVLSGAILGVVALGLLVMVGGIYYITQWQKQNEANTDDWRQ